jgi:hypothetical protein
VKPFQILQNRSKTNVFVIDWEEEKKTKKNEASFFWSKAKKNEYNRSSTIEDLPLLVGRPKFCKLKKKVGWVMGVPPLHFLSNLGVLASFYHSHMTNKQKKFLKHLYQQYVKLEFCGKWKFFWKVCNKVGCK